MKPRDRLSDEQWFAEFYGSHVRAAAASGSNLELVHEFSALIAPLEARASKPLGEPGRQKCLAAFYESPEGFRRLADEAWKRGKTNPIGLLVHMVGCGEHRGPA